MILKAFSKGLYANWYFYAPDRVLFDCGEGAILRLRQGIFAVEKIFLSHGHIDHIAGLPAFICLRESTKGDNLKPLTIYYPKQDRSVHCLQQFVTQMTGSFIKYPLEWIGIEAGERIDVRKGRVVEAFAARHSGRDPLGYRILETRKRLRSELAGRSGPELALVPDNDKYDYYEANRFSYSGDTMPLSPSLFTDADILVHDSTFLKASDRNAPLHATADEAFGVAAEARVKHLILCHISPRYESPRRIKSLIEKINSRSLRYDWIPHDRLFEM